MTYSKPESFEEQQKAPLQPALKLKAFEKVLKAYNPVLCLDKLDLKAHVTFRERFSENLESLKNAYPNINIEPSRNVQNDLEKYEAMWEKKKDEWGID